MPATRSTLIAASTFWGVFVQTISVLVIARPMHHFLLSRPVELLLICFHKVRDRDLAVVIVSS